MLHLPLLDSIRFYYAVVYVPISLDSGLKAHCPVQVELRAPAEIAVGSTIRIAGLFGSSTPDTDQLAVTGLRIAPLAR